MSTIRTITAAAIIIAAAFSSSCTCTGNITGRTHSEAVEEATSWAKDMGIPARGVSCQRNDTNDDGYVSCTVSAPKADGTVQVLSIECAAAFTSNTGCRTARIIPTGGQ